MKCENKLCENESETNVSLGNIKIHLCWNCADIIFSKKSFEMQKMLLDARSTQKLQRWIK